ncbi:MAG TPA: lycopene cyclase domain-containing protein [Pseudonocardiaceae bacterium]
MARLTYVTMLVFVLLAVAPLEVFLRTRVLARWRLLGLTLLCVAPLFLAWDLFAVAAGHWTFGLELTLGIVLPGGLPLEEALFFLVVPLASVLSLEAVRAVNARRRRGR